VWGVPTGDDTAMRSPVRRATVLTAAVGQSILVEAVTSHSARSTERPRVATTGRERRDRPVSGGEGSRVPYRWRA
jgi:hypothetical protein